MRFSLIYIFILLSVTIVVAQDPVFTQFHNIPETINPAFTGASGDFRVGVVHRTQWPKTDLKINTQYAYVDKWLSRTSSGIGISFLNNTQTFLNQSYRQINVNYAYHLQLSRKWYINPGISIGYGAKSLSYKDLVFSDQIDLNQGIISGPSIENFSDQNVSFVDFSTGLLIYGPRLWIGASLRHINKPSIQYSNGTIENINYLMSAHFSYRHPLNFSISTRIQNAALLFMSNFLKQDQYSRLDSGLEIILDNVSFGMLVNINPIKLNQSSQTLTALHIVSEYAHKNLKFGLSYGLSTSKTLDVDTGGIYELSIQYSFNNYRGVRKPICHCGLY